MDHQHLVHALRLARRGLGQTAPNPAVGCVLVKDGHVIGRGWTQSGGRPHAETIALREAGTAARGATAYVSLEPCAHHGRTPPCADALIAAGIVRVVIPMTDPDPRVDGAGIARLKAAGVNVDIAEWAEPEARKINAGFFKRHRCGRPFLTLKLATSLDGRIATSHGQSRWITGPESRRKVHMLRAEHDAILVGAGTARADDPALTVRGIGRTSAPVRIVADGRLSLSLTSQLAQTATFPPLWILHAAGADPVRAEAWREIGATLIETDATEGAQLNPVAMMKSLGAHDLTRVFCEGGGKLAAALLRAGLVDELITFQAGMALGGDAHAAIAPLALSNLAEAARFNLTDIRTLGDDVMMCWSPLH